MQDVRNAPVEISTGIFEISLPLPARPSSVNIYLLDCGSGWVLVDTGMNTPQSLAALESSLETVGCRFQDIKLIIATHHHPDHFGASSYLRERTGATVYIHAKDAARAQRLVSIASTPITQRPESLAFFRKHGFPIDRYPPELMRPSWMGTAAYQPMLDPDGFLEDNLQLEVGTRLLRIVWTPGHSPGHCVIYLEREKILIAGDHLLPKITPHVGLYPEDEGNPLREFLNSLQKIQNLDVQLVLPAHGPVFRDHRGRARQLIEHHRVRKQKMLNVLKERPCSAFEVAHAVFGDEERPVFHTMAATFETLAHLELACAKGEALKVEKNGQIIYQSA